jgi:YNFM family putative membrane transporter
VNQKSSQGTRLRRGTGPFRAVCVAVFLCGFSLFGLLYSVQALLPVFADDFGVSPAESSLALSFATAAVAVSIFFSGAVADVLGRKPVIVLSLTSAAALTLVATLIHRWPALLACRALTGLMIGGVPSVLMAYMAEEIDEHAVGLATGLYIAGSALGGMVGRLAAGVLADLYSWRVALALLGAVSLLGACYCWRKLPVSRHFTVRRVPISQLMRRYQQPLQDAGLPWMFLAGTLLMGGFVTVYNYLGFRLLRAPFFLSPSAASLVFTMYLTGMISSTWVGSLAGRYGRRRLYWPAVLVMLAGVLLTLTGSLWSIVAGVGLMTFGFFGAHSVASSWVGLRGRDCHAQAASLYLFGFYVGSSVAGSLGGLAWSRFGWPGVATLVATLVTLALAIALRLARLPPLPRSAAMDPLAAAG